MMEKSITVSNEYDDGCPGKRKSSHVDDGPNSKELSSWDDVEIGVGVTTITKTEEPQMYQKDLQEQHDYKQAPKQIHSVGPMSRSKMDPKQSSSVSMEDVGHAEVTYVMLRELGLLDENIELEEEQPEPISLRTADSDEGPTPLMMTTLRRSHEVHMESLGEAPGAYNILPGSEPERRLFPAGTMAHSTANEASQTNDSTLGEIAASTNSQSGLAVANPVEDDPNDSHNMREQAQEVDLAELAQKEALSNKKWLLILRLGYGMLCIAILALLFGLTLGISPPNSTTSLRLPRPGTSTNETAASIDVENYVYNLFPDYTRFAMRNPYSPQSKAFDWIMEDDTMLTIYMQDEGRLMQLFALVTLYYSMKGDTWRNNKGWLNRTTHECQWYGRQTFQEHEQDFTEVGVGFSNSCSESRNITAGGDRYKHLWLWNNELQGTIPPEICLLSNLESIALYYNNKLGGTIPSCIGQIADLGVFAVGITSLSGTIPDAIGDLHKLSVLWLLENQLTGSIPSVMGKLTLMEDLLLDVNMLTSIIPTQLGLLTDLSFLFLKGNRLDSTVPSELGSCTNLKMLYLDENRLMGSIPTELGNLESMEMMQLYTNLLTSTIPTELFQLTHMFQLDLDGNQLTGSIASQIGLLTALEDLWLSRNDFRSEIPSEVGMLTNLWRLNLGGNSLNGEIPSELGLLTNLGNRPGEVYPSPWAGRVWLNDNSIRGEIPSELGLLSNLPILLLQNNELSGEIPFEFLQLTTGNESTLQELNLTGNEHLVGMFPEGACLMEHLEFDCTSQLCGCHCSSCS